MKKSARPNPAPVPPPLHPILEGDDVVLDADASDEREDAVETGEARIVARPDGYHWIAPDGRQEFGPFASLEEARADMAEGGENQTAHGALLNEAEADIGQADWIDPETGDLAEGWCPPHIDDD